jgi:hypothetical protein
MVDNVERRLVVASGPAAFPPASRCVSGHFSWGEAILTYEVGDGQRGSSTVFTARAERQEIEERRRLAADCLLPQSRFRVRTEQSPRAVRIARAVLILVGATILGVGLFGALR